MSHNSRYAITNPARSALFLRYWCLKLLREILHIATDIPDHASVTVLKNSLKISDQTKAGFVPTEIYLEFMESYDAGVMSCMI